MDAATITSFGDWVGAWMERSPVTFLALFFFGTTCLATFFLYRCSTRNVDIIRSLQEAKDARIVALERQLEAKDKDTRTLEAINARDAALQAQINDMASFMRGGTPRKRKAADDESG